MPDAGIVIVTHNSGTEIGACLDAAIATGADIVVVDNASCDATIDEVTRRGVRLIANSRNRGFAAAVNQGFAVLKHECILLLNPDSVIEKGFEELEAVCRRSGAAGAGGCLLGSDGRPQTGFMVRTFPTPCTLILEALLLNRIWSNNPVNRRYRGLGLDYSRCLQVEQPAGAFLMLRREVWRELGGFDEAFFPLWFEDVDFCRRAMQGGFVLYYTPEAVAKHTGAHSIANLSVETRRFYWYRSLLRYSAKHFGPISFRGVCLAVVAGSCLRAGIEVALHRSLKPMAACGDVIRLAGRCLFTGWRDESVAFGPLLG